MTRPDFAAHLDGDCDPAACHWCWAIVAEMALEGRGSDDD